MNLLTQGQKCPIFGEPSRGECAQRGQQYVHATIVGSNAGRWNGVPWKRVVELTFAHV